MAGAAQSHPEIHPRAAAYTLSPEEVSRALDTSFDGLSSDEAGRRLALEGPNELAKAAHRPAWKLLAAQFTNVLVIILLAATVLTVAVGHTVEAITIAVIVVAAALLGFAQEYRAEKAIDVLRQMATPGALVLRDGRETPIESPCVVRGDVLILRAGNRIPADGRIFEASALEAQESALTGESTPVVKSIEALSEAGLVAGDQTNMAFAGTLVTSGRGRALVVATASRTEFGRIAHLLGTIDTSPTPLQANLDGLAKMLARAAVGLLFVVAAVGLSRGEQLADALVFGAALAVAVVPEALPAVVTISLALGAQRMVARRALIRRLPAVETLGCTSVICSDKTGTLTRDEMTVRRLFVAGQTIEVSGTGYGPLGDFIIGGVRVDVHRFSDHGLEEPLRLLFAAAALASDADVVLADGTWLVQGEPTEGALVALAAKAGLRKSVLEAEWPRVAEIPFTSEARWMATLHQTPGSVVAFVKGAPEAVLPRCRWLRTADGVSPVDASALESIQEHAHLMADQALRVLALATRSDATVAGAGSELEFLGMVGIADPPRDEAKPAIAKCRRAGIDVAMITGDHPRTARAVALELGLLGGGRVVTGRELELMDDEEFRRDVGSIQVFARVSPEQKLRIVMALQANGHVVAVTGDGVNDAPALKRADIGIAMGIKGTDVAREAAAVTLTDDNFASIVAAIEEGRTIFGNIKKYLMFLLSSNVGEIGLMAGALVAGLPMPLLAVQILFVNLATDGLPALALAVDPPDRDVMERPPRDPFAGVFARRARMLMLVAGAWSSIANLALFAWAVESGAQVEHARTLVFVSLIVIQLMNAYNFRSDRASVFERPFANAWLNAVIVGEVIVLVALVALPSLQSLLGTQSLTQTEWLMVLAVGLSSTVVLEGSKWLARRGIGWFA